MWSEDDSKKVLTALESTFRETPRQFFTEHDLHSHLYQLVERKLVARGKLFVNTLDNQRISLLHHEYPTPFRCNMSKHGFRIAKDDERTLKGGLYRRGHYDLAILNSEFAKQHNLVTVAGKNYKQLLLTRDKINVTPLLWVCEIIFGAHIEDDLPKNWVKHVTQDSLKVIETLSYKVGKDVNFAAHGSVIVFLGIKPNAKTKRLKEEIRRFNSSKQFDIRFQTA